MKFLKWFPGVQFGVKLGSTLVLLSGSLYEIFARSIIPFYWILFWFRGFFWCDEAGDDPTPTGTKVAHVDIKLFLSASTASTNFSGWDDGETFEIFLLFVALVYKIDCITIFVNVSVGITSTSSTSRTVPFLNLKRINYIITCSQQLFSFTKETYKMISHSTELVSSCFYWNIRALKLDFYDKRGEKKRKFWKKLQALTCLSQWKSFPIVSYPLFCFHQ